MAYEASKDGFAAHAAGDPSAPARRPFAVTPDNDNDLALYARAFHIGVGGDVALIPIDAADDTPVVFKNCASGSTLSVMARRVRATGTTATNIVALR